ncbi:MAG: helix-turn-helix transcriptional regulator [Bacteroidales bacterium]|nr:helix-turn-helix transcriptional regulator [Bacteroidales bacterium]
MKRTNKLLRGIFVFMMLAVASLATLATEATARVQNYDRWKDLPSPTLLDMGNDFWHSDKIDSALVCFMILYNRYSEKQSEKEKKFSCGATVGVANLYLQQYFDYQMANRYILKAEKIATSNHFEKQLAHIYIAKAILSDELTNLSGNYQSRPNLTHWKKAYRQAVNSYDMGNACVCVATLISLAVGNGLGNEIEEELKDFNRIDIPDSIPFKDFVINLCSGATAFAHKDYEQALKIFKDLSHVTIRGMHPSNSAKYNIVSLSLQSVALDSLHRDVEVLQAFKEIERITTEQHIEDQRIATLCLICDYYSNHGNTALAQEYELKYYKAKDEFINRSKLLSVDQQQFLLELEEMGEEVKDLEAQKRVRDLVILGIGLLALIIIGILIFVWRNYQNTRQRNLLLFQKNQELLALEAQEKERRAQQGEVKKYKSSPMDDPAKDELLQRIYVALESNQSVYEEGFTLDQLARLVDANPNYVSQVINEKTGSNFNTFINEYRIKEACRRLSDSETRGTYTVEAIGQSVGFKSRTNFTAIFKKFTGMTPAAYQRAARSGTPPVAVPDESHTSPA